MVKKQQEAGNQSSARAKTETDAESMLRYVDFEHRPAGAPL